MATSIRDNGDGTSSVIEITYDNEGDFIEKEIEQYDNETGRSLEWNEEERRWIYPKDFFQEFNEDLQEVSN